MMKSLKETSRANADTDPAVDLFEDQGPKQGTALRTREQQEQLAKLARELAEMLDTLDVTLKVDREQAVPMLAESSGLLEVAVEQIGRIREVDEKFGGGRRHRPRVATLAEKLEKGLAYLQGMFSAISTGENLSPFNWKLIERDVQMVLGICRAISDEIKPPKLNDAA